MNSLCLYCRKPLAEAGDFHPRCSKTFFGVFPPPATELTLATIKEVATHSILNRTTVTGVQKKLSLGISSTGRESRLTIVGYKGVFILKPPSDDYPYLPENEDTTMRLAEVLHIPVVPHAMIRLVSGEYAFITRRIDRTTSGSKLAMEDFCQLSERLTEDKYKGSVERIGKILQQHSIYPGLDVIDLFERILFCHITGNADMHLKNYSLIETPQGIRLSPAYDLLSTKIALPEDLEESALTINGKKAKLKQSDFDALAKNLEIADSACVKIYQKYKRAEEPMHRVIEGGALPEEMKVAYKLLLHERLEVCV